MNKKITDAINTTSTLIKFTTINSDFSNIEEVYQNNLLLWFINNSDSVETKDRKGIEIHNNTVLNPENIVVLKTKRGFKITEKDFIKSDLETLENLNVNLLTFLEKKQFEFYKNYLKKKNTEPQQKEIERISNDVKSKHPTHDPNLWGLQCYRLFQYLFDNYYTSTKRQITNIWFFLSEYDKIKYNLKATKDKYKEFIYRNYNISIKNFDKAPAKYLQEYGTMNDHRINYEDSI